ncbi:hypothetical protein Tco_0655591 [Tanacetum coccineum]|uniref:Uncharacterized protein n=1 Tax=Tanacetum coccineum TaxID=301880 RepID=A0ABQ4X7L6_9ASTR
MPPKRTSTSAALAMTQAAIRQLVADSVATALEAQAANMANTDNTNGNTRHYNKKSREVFQLTQVCGSRDAFPSLVVPLVHLSLPLVSLSFQPRTYNLSTLPFRDSVQIARMTMVVKKFPENENFLVVKNSGE